MGTVVNQQRTGHMPSPLAQLSGDTQPPQPTATAPWALRTAECLGVTLCFIHRWLAATCAECPGGAASGALSEPTPQLSWAGLQASRQQASPHVPARAGGSCSPRPTPPRPSAWTFAVPSASWTHGQRPELCAESAGAKLLASGPPLPPAHSSQFATGRPSQTSSSS